MLCQQLIGSLLHQCCGCFRADSGLVLLLSKSVPKGCEDLVRSQQAVLCKTCSQLVITNLAAVLSMQTICVFRKLLTKCQKRFGKILDNLNFVFFSETWNHLSLQSGILTVHM